MYIEYSKGKTFGKPGISSGREIVLQVLDNQNEKFFLSNKHNELYKPKNLTVIYRVFI